MSVTQIKPPNNEPATIGAVTVFLAGSIEMDKAELWQDDVFEHIRKTSSEEMDVAVYNPRRDNWNNEWKQSVDDRNFVFQVEWELDHLERCDIAAFYFQPGTNSPISLMELGIVSMASFSGKKKVVVLCPDGFHRKGNVDITAMWFDMYIAKDMDDFKSTIARLIAEHDPNYEKDMNDLTERLG
jgi:hypothetical protein